MTTLGATPELFRLREVGTVDTGTDAAVRTFLIADIRGYTAFSQERGDDAASRLALRFAAIAREMVALREGRVIELAGDQALAVFKSPRQALRAALELQGRFAHECDTDPSLPLRVGIGIDAGEAVPVEDGYRGRSLNLASRLCSLAAPGEVLVSRTIVSLAGRIGGFTYLDRGEAQLKGFAEPVSVIQVVVDNAIPDRISRFSVHEPPGSPLPRHSNTFVGRAREVTTIVEMVQREDISLLTLLGPGGVGKTRLAFEVGRRLAPQFPAGVPFVSLASITDPDLVVPTIAGVLGLREVGNRSSTHRLKAHIADKRLLMVLDNFEHLLAAAPVLADLLTDCTRLRLLVTSRAPLRVAGEQEFPLSPLAVPDLKHVADADDVAHYDSVALFVQQAKAVKPDFAVTHGNASAVSEICVHLDGLPLAIELAAARIRLFSPQALLSRLSSRLALLTSGARDVPERHQTLRNTIEWSYSLLNESQRRIFACLSCFSGGCRLEAAESVCEADGSPPLTVLDGIASLVEQNLLRQELDDDSEPRFVMLETIREYALERLAVSGKGDAVRRRHATHYLVMAEQAWPALERQEPAGVTDRLERDHDNFRTALRWTLDHQEADIALRLVWALTPFWTRRGYRDEAQGWIDEVLASCAFPPSRLSARMLRVAGGLASMRGDHGRAETLIEQALAVSRSLGDVEEEAEALDFLHVVQSRRGDFTQAVPFWGKQIAKARARGDRRALARYLDLLGTAARYQGDSVRAGKLYQESLELYRGLGHENVAEELMNLGLLDADQEENPRATRLLTESVRLFHDRKIYWPIVSCLDGLARIAAVEGNAVRAVRLWGAAEMLSSRFGFRPGTLERSVGAKYISIARDRLTASAFAEAWEDGHRMELEDAIRFALGNPDP